MKIVKHPAIINMVDVFEDKRCIYLVMPLVEFGDFFERWSKRKTFPENMARKIVWKLLDAVAYLHGLGIVHRDLKPENILCLSETDDTAIVISDFGLSKFAAPHEEMTMPCGTLAYVAPEVLAMKGYDRKVDLWSIGCIMHLLLRGVLPFDGHTRDQVIERTLQKPLNLSNPAWAKISNEGKELLRALLQKNPGERCGVREAMEMPWFDPVRQEMSDWKKRLTSQYLGLVSVAATATVNNSPNAHKISPPTVAATVSPQPLKSASANKSAVTTAATINTKPK